MLTSADKSRQTSRNNRTGRLLLKEIILTLNLYPVLRRQIQSNHQMRFEKHDKRTNFNANVLEHGRNQSKSKSHTNQHHQEPLMEELATIKRWQAFHYNVAMSIYAIEPARYLFIHLISLEALSEYHYLDCYMLGRFRFIGRTNKISSSVMLIFLFAFALYRYIIIVLKPDFKNQFLEFLLYDYEHVVENENEFQSSQRVGKKLDLIGKKAANSLESHTEFNRIQPNRIFYLENKSYGDSVHFKWILRPNRTGKSWITLSAITRYGFYSIIVVSISFMLLMSYTLAGSIVTNLGFELSYPTCVAYIQSKQQGSETASLVSRIDDNITTAIASHRSVDYSHIYLAPKILAHQKRIEEIPAHIAVSQIDWQSMTTYSLIRIALDIIENIFWYLDFLSICISTAFLILMCSVDIMINADGAMKRLQKLIGTMAAEQQSQTINSDSLRETRHYTGQSNLFPTPPELDHFNYLRDSRRTCFSNSRHYWMPKFRYHQIFAYRAAIATIPSPTDTETTIVQAILIDHFMLVRDYANLVSFYFNFVISLYVEYLLIICTWTSMIKSRTVEFEFFITEASLTVLAVVFFSNAALARSLNYKLYKYIAQAMALDTDSVSKRRWAVIMNFYQPRPMYCLLLFNTIEISWLFCLQFASWMVSLFVVLANFFYINRN